MTAPGRRINGRRFNGPSFRFWSLAAPIYDTPALQRLFYQPVQDEVIGATQRTHGSRRVAGGCLRHRHATSPRIHNELDTDEVYGVDMSDGMLAQNPHCGRVRWLKGPAEHVSPFDDAAPWMPWSPPPPSTSSTNRWRCASSTGCSRRADCSRSARSVRRT